MTYNGWSAVGPLALALACMLLCSRAFAADPPAPPTPPPAASAPLQPASPAQPPAASGQPPSGPPPRTSNPTPGSNPAPPPDEDLFEFLGTVDMDDPGSAP